MRPVRLLAVTLLLAALALPVAEWALWRTVPQSNTAQTHFDVILVLGNPSRPDGTPAPEQRERVLEGIREYRRGVAPRLVMSGGAAHNGWVEAETMARFAQQQGVPPADILIESQARDTIQNIFYTAAILHQHGWTSAEVVSTGYHLPRTARILAHFPLAWRTDPAPWPPEYRFYERWARDWHEANSCFQLRLHGFKPSAFISR